MIKAKKIERMIKDVEYVEGMLHTQATIHLHNGGSVSGFTKNTDKELVNGVQLNRKLAYKNAYRELEAIC
jgi:hypothetical protein